MNDSEEAASLINAIKRLHQKLLKQGPEVNYVGETHFLKIDGFDNNGFELQLSVCRPGRDPHALRLNAEADAVRYRKLEECSNVEERDGGYTSFYRVWNVPRSNFTGPKKDHFHHTTFAKAVDEMK